MSHASYIQCIDARSDILCIFVVFEQLIQQSDECGAIVLVQHVRTRGWFEPEGLPVPLHVQVKSFNIAHHN